MTGSLLAKRLPADGEKASAALGALCSVQPGQAMRAPSHAQRATMRPLAIRVFSRCKHMRPRRRGHPRREAIKRLRAPSIAGRRACSAYRIRDAATLSKGEAVEVEGSAGRRDDIVVAAEETNDREAADGARQDSGFGEVLGVVADRVCQLGKGQPSGMFGEDEREDGSLHLGFLILGGGGIATVGLVLVHGDLISLGGVRA